VTALRQVLSGSAGWPVVDIGDGAYAAQMLPDGQGIAGIWGWSL